MGCSCSQFSDSTGYNMVPEVLHRRSKSTEFPKVPERSSRACALLKHHYHITLVHLDLEDCIIDISCQPVRCIEASSVAVDETWCVIARVHGGHSR